MKRASFDECYDDSVEGLKARCRNYFIDTRADVANETLTEGTVDNAIISRFGAKGYSYEAALDFIQTLRTTYSHSS
jgi:hypothetical protein